MKHKKLFLKLGKIWILRKLWGLLSPKRKTGKLEGQVTITYGKIQKIKNLKKSFEKTLSVGPQVEWKTRKIKTLQSLNAEKLKSTSDSNETKQKNAIIATPKINQSGVMSVDGG